MFAWIDGLWWLDLVGALALGVWAGRRWQRVKMQAKCDARACDTIIDLRREKMAAAADKLKMEQVHEFMRSQLQRKDEALHSLRTSKGMLQREVEKLTHQIPRQERRMAG